MRRTDPRKSVRCVGGLHHRRTPQFLSLPIESPGDSERQARMWRAGAMLWMKGSWKAQTRSRGRIRDNMNVRWVSRSCALGHLVQRYTTVTCRGGWQRPGEFVSRRTAERITRTTSSLPRPPSSPACGVSEKRIVGALNGCSSLPEVEDP